MKQMKRKRFLALAVLFLGILMLAVPVQAAKYKNVWKKQNQNVYYYNDKGKKATGLTQIGGKSYYFDGKGIQRVGWQKIGSQYYFFQIANGKKGSMVKGKKINDITLDKKGRAKKTQASLRKLKIMVEANKVVEKQTKPLMTKPQKLKICFEYAKKTYKYATWRSFTGKKGWELDYAEDMFYKGRGNCFSYAAAFAFMANAVGCSDVYAISSGGHGWAEINGLVFDPDWALVSKVDTYFAMPYSLSGVQGRPNYKANRVYIAGI